MPATDPQRRTLSRLECLIYTTQFFTCDYLPASARLLVLIASKTNGSNNTFLFEKNRQCCHSFVKEEKEYTFISESNISANLDAWISGSNTLFLKHGINVDILTCIITHSYKYMHAHPTSTSTSERLSRLDLEIHEVGHQEHIVPTERIISHKYNNHVKSRI
jgi:hypothetical protein